MTLSSERAAEKGRVPGGDRAFSSLAPRPAPPVRPEIRVFVAISLFAILAGGLVSAANGISHPSAHVSWAAAYLVLVVGIAQALLGVGQAAIARKTTMHWVVAELFGWNLGSAGVLAGVLLSSTVVVDIGSVAMLVALAAFATRARRGNRGTAKWWQIAYALLLVVLVASVVSGVFLARSWPPQG